MKSYYRLYFTLHFSQSFSESGTWHDSTVLHGAQTVSSAGDQYEIDGGGDVKPSTSGAGAWVTFPSTEGHTTIGVVAGISYVSIANAEENLLREDPPGTPFEAVRQSASAVWNRALSKILVRGGTRDDRSVFYTALYHTMLQPNVLNDSNGEYPGLDRAVHRLPIGQGAQYTNFDSLWDIYRSYVQLVALINPDLTRDFVKSLVNDAHQNDNQWDRTTHISGAVHTMNGDDVDPVIADAVAFGVGGFDLAGTFTSLVDSATTVTASDVSSAGCPTSCIGERPSLPSWESLHYIPVQAQPRDGVVSDSLEYATDDFALSQLALRLGDQARYKYFLARSGYWRNLYNPKATEEAGYLQPRNTDGTWPTFDPTADRQDQGYVEDSATIYGWMVPFDVRGLFDLLGGNTAANNRLDAFFHDKDGHWSLVDGGVNADFTNEPSLETPWLYDFSGQPFKTQATVRQIIDSLWSDAPYGIPGNDDMGEMSSWYVWAALGMYPEIPGRAELVLASPLFPEIQVRRALGEISIKAPGASASTPYVRSLLLNGQPYSRPWLPESFAAHGGTLEYKISTSPNTQWGSGYADAPPSFPPQ